MVSSRSSVTTRSAAARAAGVPAPAEGDADVGQPDRRGVVGAVAGHRHGPPGTSAAPGRSGPCGPGCTRATTSTSGSRSASASSSSWSSSAAGDHPLFVVLADGGGDRLGGGRVVAGDHDGVHAGLPEPAYGRGGARAAPRRRGPGSPRSSGPSTRRRRSTFGAVRRVALGDGQHPVARPASSVEHPRPAPRGRRRPAAPARRRCAAAEQRGSTVSGAPLTLSSSRPSVSPDARVVAAGRLERQPAGGLPAGGTGLLRRPRPRRRPARPPGRSAAPDSVRLVAAGWPAAPPPAIDLQAVVQPVHRRVPVAGRRRPRRAASLPSVRVPVLSKQSTSTRPSASMVRGLRTSAPCSASRRAAASCAALTRNGSPSGTDADGEVRGGRRRLGQGYAPQQARAGHRHRGTGGQRDGCAGQRAEPGLHPAGGRGLPDQWPGCARPRCPARSPPPRPCRARRRRWCPRRASSGGRRSAAATTGRSDLGHRQRLAGQRRLVDLQAHGLQHPAVGGHRVARLAAR